MASVINLHGARRSRATSPACADSAAHSGPLPSPYALRILADDLAPELPAGCCALFDPSAGLPQAGDIAAVWIRGAHQPSVVRLATAVPPVGPSAELEPVLTALFKDGRVAALPMSRVSHVHRFVRVAGTGEVAHA